MKLGERVQQLSWPLTLSLVGVQVGKDTKSRKKISSAIISLYFSKSQLRHIFPPNSAALDRDCQRTIPTDEQRNHFPTHSHTVISSFSFLDSRFWSLWWQFWLIFISIGHLFWTNQVYTQKFGNTNHSGSYMPMHGSCWPVKFLNSHFLVIHMYLL